MPLTPRVKPTVSDFWQIMGHSFFNYQTGPSSDQTGRMDALFRMAFDVEPGNWRNYAVNGAQVTKSGRQTGGWARWLQYVGQMSGRTAPYAPQGGASLTCIGINDMGVYGGHLAAVRESIVDATRMVISRARCSRSFLVTDAAFAYGAGFSSNASGIDLGQGPTDRLATTTTAATITMTLPADYAGETVVFGFLKRPDLTGGTLTFSGTAGVTGTFYTQTSAGGIPSAFLNNSYTVKRITNLTAANAGQTIILTLTSLDASGNVFFDGAWFESLTPPPVIVCNVAKLTTAGYTNSLYATWRTGAGSSDATMDGNVDTLNAALGVMVGEFDGMAQIADIDSAINKDASRTSDGLHPNEKGAGYGIDAIIAAYNRCTPPASSWGMTLGFNPPAPRPGPDRRSRIATNWYTSEGLNPAATYTPVVGDVFAYPFVVTEGTEQFSQFGCEVTTAGTVGSTVRWAVYDDVNWSGYPQDRFQYDPTTASAFTLSASTGLKNQSMAFTWPPDPGLYWMAIKFDTTGTGQVLRGATAVYNSPYLPQRGTTGILTALNTCWKLTGQGASALPASFPTGAALAATGPVLQILKSK